MNEYTAQFKKDLKLVKSRGKKLKKLEKIMMEIYQEKPLSKSFKDHPLQGNWLNHRECHIEPDWLLIYKLLKKRVSSSICKDWNSL